MIFPFGAYQEGENQGRRGVKRDGSFSPERIRDGFSPTPSVIIIFASIVAGSISILFDVVAVITVFALQVGAPIIRCCRR